MRKSFDGDERKKIQNKKFFRLKSVCFFRKRTTRINVDDENLVILAVFISNILSKNIVSNLLSKGSYLRCFYKLLNKKKSFFFSFISLFESYIIYFWFSNMFKVTKLDKKKGKIEKTLHIFFRVKCGNKN